MKASDVWREILDKFLLVVLLIFASPFLITLYLSNLILNVLERKNGKD